MGLDLLSCKAKAKEFKQKLQQNEKRTNELIRNLRLKANKDLEDERKAR